MVESYIMHHKQRKKTLKVHITNEITDVIQVHISEIRIL